MPGETTNEESKTSVADIASMLLKPVAPTVNDEADEQSPGEGTTDETDLDTDVTEGDDPEEQDQDDLDQSSEDEDEDEDADDKPDEDGQPQIIDVQDDDLIDVMIDGKLEQRTLGELKKAIAGEGAIEKRLQEATEVRKTAHAERTAILEELADQERLVAQALTSLDENVFKAFIPAPDPRLKDADPKRYLRHKEAYDEDQKRIAEGKKVIETQVAALAAQRQKRLEEYGKAAAPVIAQLIPELTDPAKAPAMLDKLVSTAKSYGYTEQEIQSALDPRMFHLVRDALAYRQLLDRSKEKRTVDLSKQGNKVPRKLRSGNTKAATMVANRAKQQEQVKQRAAQTGKVGDVAAMILKNRGK